MILRSLPARPIAAAELDRFAERDRVERTLRFATYGTGGVEWVLQFAVETDGRFYGLHFCPFREQWESVGSEPTLEHVATALAAARGD